MLTLKRTLLFSLTLTLLLLSTSCSSILPSPANITGKWDAVITVNNSTVESVADLTKDATDPAKFAGFMVGSFEGEIIGDSQTGDFTIGTDISVSGRFYENEFTGTYTAIDDEGETIEDKLTMTRQKKEEEIKNTVRE